LLDLALFGVIISANRHAPEYQGEETKHGAQCKPNQSDPQAAPVLVPAEQTAPGRQQAGAKQAGSNG